MPALPEIHPITGAVIDSEFGNPLADRLDIAGVSRSEAFNFYLDTRSCLNVAETIKPMRRDRSFEFRS